MLQEDDALAAETTSKKNQDTAGLEGRTGFRRVDRFANLDSTNVSRMLSRSTSHGPLADPISEMNPIECVIPIV